MHTTIKALLTEKDVSRILNVTTSWLQKGRCQGTHGPDYVKINGAIRYRRDDVEAYLNRNRVQLRCTNVEEGA